MNKNIILLLFFILVYSGITAQIKISGIVLDQDNFPLIGASVLEKGTTNGVITDIDGAFSFSVSSKEAILVISYIGLTPKEIPVNDQTEFNISLAEDATVFEEVVVIGYGTQKRSNISGSVGVVTAEEITETPVLRVEQALQGRTAGIQVTQNSGSPGSALTVRVRGTGTINDSNPLYVVDGVIVEGMDFLNPNDLIMLFHRNY